MINLMNKNYMQANLYNKTRVTTKRMIKNLLFVLLYFILLNLKKEFKPLIYYIIQLNYMI